MSDGQSHHSDSSQRQFREEQPDSDGRQDDHRVLQPEHHVNDVPHPENYVFQFHNQVHDDRNSVILEEIEDTFYSVLQKDERRFPILSDKRNDPVKGGLDFGGILP